MKEWDLLLVEEVLVLENMLLLPGQLQLLEISVNIEFIIINITEINVTNF